MHLVLYYNIIKTYCVCKCKNIFPGVSEFFSIAIYHEEFCFWFAWVPWWEVGSRGETSEVDTRFSLCVLLDCTPRASGGCMRAAWRTTCHRTIYSKDVGFWKGSWDRVTASMWLGHWRGVGGPYCTLCSLCPFAFPPPPFPLAVHVRGTICCPLHLCFCPGDRTAEQEGRSTWKT